MATPKTISEDLDKIIKEIGEFQAEYRRLAASEKPIDCQLPPEVEGEIELPPVDLPEINKPCAPAFVEFPLVVEPFSPPESCEDGFNVNVNEVEIYSELGADEPAGTFNIEVKQNEVNVCDYEIYIPPIVIPCFPTGPKITGSARITVTDLNDSSTKITDLTIIKKPEEPCTWTFGGETEIVIPEIPCPNGIRFNPGNFRIHSTCATVPPQQKPITITQAAAECAFDIHPPDITIPCYPNGPRVHGEIEVVVTDRGEVVETQTAGFPENQSLQCCDFPLGGQINIEVPCQDGIGFEETTFNIRATPTSTPVPQTITIEPGADICNFVVDFPDITIPCYPNGPVHTGVIQIKTLDGTVDTLDFNEALDPSVPCKWNWDPIDINLPIPSCPGGMSFTSDVRVYTSRGNEIPRDPVDPDVLRRYHTLKLRPAGGNPKDCGAVLEGELNLGLPPFATACNALQVGNNNSVVFTFNPAQTTPQVLGLRTLDSGCGFEFSTPVLNIPAMVCDSSTPYAVESNWNVWIGNTKLPNNKNTTKLQSKYVGSPHCGLQFVGDLFLPEFPGGGGGAFNYRIWNYGDTYDQGDVVSVVFPEGGRCTYRVISPEGSPAGLTPTAPEAKGVWQSLGCEDEKVFHPFKIIKTQRLKNQPGNDLQETYVKVIPRSHLFKNAKADSTFKIFGLDTPFSLKPNEIVYLEVFFDATGNNIVPKHAAICVSDKWDSPVNEGAPNELPGVYNQLYKTARPDHAKDIHPSLYTQVEVAQYVGLDNTERDKIIAEQQEIIQKISLLQDNRPRQLKAWILIGKADEGVVKSTGDINEVEAVLLKQADRQYGVEQRLTRHILLVTKNIDNVPLVLIEPYDGNDAKLNRLQSPTISVTGVGDEIQISFSSPPQLDIFGESRSIGTDSSDIHVYYTTDGTSPTIDTKENTNCYLYEGGTEVFPAEGITGDICFMAVNAFFRRSDMKRFVVS